MSLDINKLMAGKDLGKLMADRASKARSDQETEAKQTENHKLLEADSYFKADGYLSNSRIKNLMQPDKKEPRDREPFRFGTLQDCYITELPRFKKTFGSIPHEEIGTWDREAQLKKKEYYFLDDTGAACYFTWKELEQVILNQHALFDKFPELFHYADSQVVLKREDFKPFGENGPTLRAKIKKDWHIPKGRMKYSKAHRNKSYVIDLKSLTARTKEEFEKRLYRYWYDQQLAFYTRVAEADGGRIVSINRPTLHHKGEIFIKDFTGEFKRSGNARLDRNLRTLLAQGKLEEYIVHPHTPKAA